MEQRHIEEVQRGEVRELKYYRLLESERAKWEAREQRALDELDQIRRDMRDKDILDATSSRQLEEAQQQEQRLQKLITGRDNSIGHLQEQLETCQSENEHLRVELEEVRVQVQELERSSSLQSSREQLSLFRVMDCRVMDCT